MLGNCSHCHNPRGLPSVKEPAARRRAQFPPAAGHRQGIFQFPLDRMSPVRFTRGRGQDTPIPYITPSLYDLPSDAPPKSFCPTEDNSDHVATSEHAGTGPSSVDLGALAEPHLSQCRHALRLLRRLSRCSRTCRCNSPGYDCRAPRIMGDWMVSIPALN